MLGAVPPLLDPEPLFADPPDPEDPPGLDELEGELPLLVEEDDELPLPVEEDELLLLAALAAGGDGNGVNGSRVGP